MQFQSERDFVIQYVLTKTGVRGLVDLKKFFLGGGSETERERINHESNSRISNYTQQKIFINIE